MNAKTANKTPQPSATENAELKAVIDAKETAEAEVKEVKAALADADKALEVAIAEKVAAEEKSGALEKELTASKAEAEQLKDALKKATEVNAETTSTVAVYEEKAERRLFTMISNVRLNGKNYKVGTSLPLTKTEHADLLNSQAVATLWHEAERA